MCIRDRDIAISCDRSGDQFREHDHISSKLQKRILSAHLSPVHIDLIRQYLEGVKAAFVTNAVSHAQTLAKMGIRVYLIGGELKSSTEAVVGSQAMQMIQMYHFTKGFFGTNGITRREGFTTPDTSEAIVKSTAMKQCKDVYILTDKSKFGEVSSVTFGGFTDAKILTEEIPKEYQDSKNILKVE